MPWAERDVNPPLFEVVEMDGYTDNNVHVGL